MFAAESPRRRASSARSGWPGVLLALVATGVWTPGLAAQLPSLGPLALAERNPLYDLFYVPHFAGADLLQPGQTQVELGIAYSNIFERSETPTHSQLFDVERMSTTVTLRRGIAARIEVGGRITVHTSWGGFMDPLIEGIHEAFGVSNGDRELVEQGQQTLSLRERNGASLVEMSQGSFAPADLHAFGRLRLVGGGDQNSALSLRATIKLPTGVDGTGTGSADVAAEFLGRRTAGPWGLHGMVGATTLSPPEALSGLSNRAAVLMGVGVERRIRPRLSVIFQAQSSSKYVSGIGEDELDDFPLIVGGGVAGSTDHGTWQVAFVEDIPPNSPSADVTLHFQFSRRWE